ncbi:MAG: response regulator transcription factor [Nitrospirae bacterium]|jgi:DNA-binding NarL/FixJ family response regulator|nr:response regulator transcription factor [Nitrospirota bacterium]
MAIRIAIGCHSYLLGEGLKKLFNKEDGIDIICIFDEGIDIEEIIKMNPDLILSDFEIFRAFPEDSTIDKKLKILLLGDNSWLSDVERQIPEFIVRGVFGIIPADADSEILKKAIKVVYSGELWLDRKMIKKIITKMGTSEKRIGLTKKEKEIILLICHGYRNKEIAQKLDISEQTVKSHCNRIFKKVGVSDRLQLALYTHKVWPGHI